MTSKFFLGQNQHSQDEVYAVINDTMLDLDLDQLHELARNTSLSTVTRIAALSRLDDVLTAQISSESDFEREVDYFMDIASRAKNDQAVSKAAMWVFIDWQDRANEAHDYLTPHQEFSNSPYYPRG